MDQSKFTQVYNLYGEMLYRVAYLYMGNSADSEDILQEVFLKYAQKVLPFKNEEHEKAWLLRVTINQCKNALNKRRVEVELNEEMISSKDEDYLLKMNLLSIIYQLPFEYKTVIILYYYNDYSVKEIASLLKLSESAVKMRLKRGREMLKDVIGEEYE